MIPSTHEPMWKPGPCLVGGCVDGWNHQRKRLVVRTEDQYTLTQPSHSWGHMTSKLSHNPAGTCTEMSIRASGDNLKSITGRMEGAEQWTLIEEYSASRTMSLQNECYSTMSAIE